MNNPLRLRLPGGFGSYDESGVAVTARRRLVRPHTVIMMVVFLGALVVGYLLLPGANERIAMLEQDGHNQQAMAMLERRFAAGDRSQRTLFQLQRLYEQAGDITRAGQLLEMLAELRPRDANIQRRLGQFYKQTQNEAKYLKALEQQLLVRYSEPVCKQLIGLYRSGGEFANEQRWLETCRQKGYRRSDDLIRLAYLIAADGKLAEATSLLRSVDDRRRLRQVSDRRLFFAALIENDQSEEAQRRALRWLKGSKDTAFALELIDGLVEDKKHDLAVNLAREVGTPGDAVSLTVAELLLDRTQDVAARAYLRGWFEVARLTEPGVTLRFIAAALDADDAELAYQGAVKFGLNRLGQSELVALAEALSASNKSNLFQEVRKLLDPQTLVENPLLAAAIEVERGANEPARALLSRVQVDNLDEWRLALWARLMETTSRRAVTLPPPPRPQAAETAAANAQRTLRRLKEARDKRAQRRQRARQAPVAGAAPQQPVLKQPPQAPLVKPPPPGPPKQPAPSPTQDRSNLDQQGG